MPRSEAEFTLADIARMAGVGVGTASRALNGAPNVAPGTRERVLQVARDHSYVISPDASRLKASRRGPDRVALVVPHISRWFYGEMVEGIISVLRAAEIDALIYNVGSSDDRRHFLDKLPVRRKVDGVIVVAFPIEEYEQAQLALLRVQVLAAGGQHADYPNVCIDDAAAGAQAMRHLLDLGHRRIAMIATIDPDQETAPMGRSCAYHAALAERGLPSDPALVVETDWGGEAGSEAMAALLRLPDPPTAVYAHSDEVAIGALRTIRRAGLRVPEDVSVIGIDDHPMAGLVDLTTVRQPVFEQGELAARMLVQILEGADVAQTQVTVPTQLVVRGSTAPPRRPGQAGLTSA